MKTYGSQKPTEFKADIDKFLRLYNDVFSTYIKTSEISRLNNSRFDNIKLSDIMAKVLELSLEISQKSQGYFDITVGPLVNAWGFGPSGKQNKPTEGEVKNILSRVGYQKIKIEEKRLHMPLDMELDLSAVAKGFGVDELVKFLEFRGYSDLLVEIGGEVRTRGKKEVGSKWRIGIEGPSETLGSKISKIVPLDNMSMATSGSYRNYLKLGDAVFNHTIDPKTGYPINHNTISVSVVSEFCTDADAWATAFMSMGYKKGLKTAQKFNLSAYFQVKEGDTIKVYATRGFDRYLKKMNKKQ